VPLEQLPALEEVVLMNMNIRGINSGTKQEALAKIVEKERPHVICLNETKLQFDLFFNNYWSHQSLLARKGGCWTAARQAKNVRHSLVKALGTYLCWTRLNTGTESVQILNCYLEGGDCQYAKQRAQRVCEVVRDILR